MEMQTSTQRRTAGAQRLLGLAMVALAAMAALMLAITARGAPPKAKPIASASGSLHIANSHQGQAVLSAAGMAPGDTVTGQVAIANSGDMPGAFTLAQRLQSETAGAGGGHIYSLLQLKISQEG